MHDFSPALISIFQTPAVALAILGSGFLLLVGLFTGVWKYTAIRASEKSRAPYYVDIAHRASLMYSFSALVLAVLAGCVCVVADGELLGSAGKSDLLHCGD